MMLIQQDSESMYQLYGKPQRGGEEDDIQNTVLLPEIFPYKYLRFLHRLLSLNIIIKYEKMIGLVTRETRHPKKIEYLIYLTGFPNQTYRPFYFPDLLTTTYVPGTILGSGVSVVNKIDKMFYLMEMTF